MVKMPKKKVGGGPGSEWGGQDGCERRMEVIVKMQKKKRRGSGWVGVVRVDVNEELKLL